MAGPIMAKRYPILSRSVQLSSPLKTLLARVAAVCVI